MIADLLEGLVADLIRSNLTKREIAESWPQTFHPEEGFKLLTRPNIGVPTFAEGAELSNTDFYARCAIYAQVYPFWGNIRATSAVRRDPGNKMAHQLPRKARRLYPEGRLH